jgi:hypothetical protein
MFGINRIGAVVAALAVLALAGGGTALAAPAPPTGAGPAAATAPTFTAPDIVIYKGNGDKTPVGPRGPLGYDWTGDITAPETIAITNPGGVTGTLVETPDSTRTAGACLKKCGEWWYSENGALLNVFDYDHGGFVTFASGLSTPLDTRSQWFTPPGQSAGVLSPKCLRWVNPGGVTYVIELNTTTYKWTYAPKVSCA